MKSLMRVVACASAVAAFTAVAQDDFDFGAGEGDAAEAVEPADGEAPVWHPDVRFFRVRGEDGAHSGAFMAVDFAKIGEAYGAKGYTIRTMEELFAAIRDAKQIKDRPVLFDIRVLPKSMTDGYGSWWRVGDTEVSENPKNVAAYRDHLEHVKTARKY